MKKSRETLNQVLSLMIVAFNQLSLGCAIGWLGPTLITLQDPKGKFQATLDETSWLACLEYVGEIPGALFASFVLDILGRKSLLTFAAMVFFLMWVINALTNSMLVLCIVRFAFGFAAGINDTTDSVYLAENSSPKIRAVFGSICATLYYIGLLAEYAIASCFSYTSASIINASVTFLALLSVLWMKEPVQYLLMRGKTEEAEKNFVWLHGGSIINEQITSEFERIKQNALSENLKKLSFKKIITSRANYKSLLIVTTLYALTGVTGYYPIISYTTMEFPTSDILTPDEFTILFGILQFLVIISTVFFIDSFSRRRILLACFSAIPVCHATTAILCYLNSHVSEIPHFPWLTFASITLSACIYVAVYPVVFIIRGELFPLSIKATGGCLSMVSWSATSILANKMFPYVSENFGIEMNFLIFFVFSCIMLVFVYCFIPETKHKTLIQIQEMLEKKR